MPFKRAPGCGCCGCDDDSLGCGSKLNFILSGVTYGAGRPTFNACDGDPIWPKALNFNATYTSSVIDSVNCRYYVQGVVSAYNYDTSSLGVNCGLGPLDLLINLEVTVDDTTTEWNVELDIPVSQGPSDQPEGQFYFTYEQSPDNLDCTFFPVTCSYSSGGTGNGCDFTSATIQLAVP